MELQPIEITTALLPDSRPVHNLVGDCFGRSWRRRGEGWRSGLQLACPLSRTPIPLLTLNPERDCSEVGYAATRSAGAAPRVPSGCSGPVVVSRAVCFSISALSCAPI